MAPEAESKEAKRKLEQLNHPLEDTLELDSGESAQQIISGCHTFSKFHHKLDHEANK